MLTTDDGRIISNPEEIANIWADYYQKLLTPEENTNFDNDFKRYIDKEVSYIIENSSSDFDDILKDPITVKETEDVLIALPNNKAPGMMA